MFCVLKYARSQSNKTVQHAFVTEFSIQSPTAMQIWTWHKKFTEEGGWAGERDLDDRIDVCRVSGGGHIEHE